MIQLVTIHMLTQLQMVTEGIKFNNLIYFNFKSLNEGR